MSNVIESSKTAMLRRGATLVTPAGHKLSLEYDASQHVYNLTIARGAGSRLEAWSTVARACARAETLLGVAS